MMAAQPAMYAQVPQAAAGIPMFQPAMQPMWSPQYYSYVQDEEDVNTSLPKEIKELETKEKSKKGHKKIKKSKKEKKQKSEK